MLSLLVTVWLVALVVTSTAFALVVAVQAVLARVPARPGAQAAPDSVADDLAPARPTAA